MFQLSGFYYNPLLMVGLYMPKQRLKETANRRRNQHPTRRKPSGMQRRKFAGDLQKVDHHQGPGIPSNRDVWVYTEFNLV